MSPVQGDPAGPFPAGADHDEYDRRRRRILWAMPSGLYVLGSVAGGRRNLMTLNWATQVATDPKLVAVSVEVNAVTNALVREGGTFALNILPRDQRAIVRKFVKPLDDDGDPSSLGGFALRSLARGSLTQDDKTGGAPVLADAAAWLLCEVRHSLDCGSHTVFIGEVVDCGGDAPEEALRMEDTKMSYGG